MFKRKDILLLLNVKRRSSEIDGSKQNLRVGTQAGGAAPLWLCVEDSQKWLSHCGSQEWLAHGQMRLKRRGAPNFFV